MGEAMLACRGIRKRFDARSILSGVNLTMNGSGIACIVGDNGCGKTTLLKILAGLERADEGTVTLFGRPFTRRDIRSPGVTYVGVHPVLLNRTVVENLEYPLVLRHVPAAERRRSAGEVLERLGLAPLGQSRALTLSAGEKQKLCLGRALIAAPKVLLLDEPTASIDPQTQTEVERLLLENVRNHEGCILMTTHQTGQARRMGERIWRLKDGVLEEET